MIYFVTKYALTAGIQRVDAEPCGTAMITWNDGYMQFAHKSDWYDTLAEAEARADVMRLAKIKTLRKSLAKFEGMKIVGYATGEKVGAA